MDKGSGIYIGGLNVVFMQERKTPLIYSQKTTWLDHFNQEV